MDEEVISLRTYFERDLANVRRETAIALEAADKAVTKAEVAAEKRFDALNEIRGQLADQIARFVPREVVDATLSQMEQRLNTLEGRTRYTDGKSRGSQRAQETVIANLAIGIALLSAIGTLINLIH
jgi:hypothetical protein